MNLLKAVLAAVAVALVLLPLADLQAADRVAIGDKGPDVSGVDTDGNAFKLSDVGDAKVVVVGITCCRCPVAVVYEDRFIEFQNAYKDKGVQFIAVNVNSTEDIKEMKARAAEKGFNFRFVLDESQESAWAYGATCTPDLFVLDKNRIVQYMGAFDDDMTNPQEPYLVNAVDALLAGKTPEKSVTKQFGCGIKWR